MFISRHQFPFLSRLMKAKWYWFTWQLGHSMRETQYSSKKFIRCWWQPISETWYDKEESCQPIISLFLQYAIWPWTEMDLKFTKGKTISIWYCYIITESQEEGFVFSHLQDFRTYSSWLWGKSTQYLSLTELEFPAIIDHICDISDNIKMTKVEITATTH